MAEQENVAGFSIRNILLRTMTIYFHNFPLMVLLGALATVLINAYLYFFNTNSMSNWGYIAGIGTLGLFAGVFAIVGMIIFTKKFETSYSNKKFRLAGAVSLSLGKFIRVIMTGLLYIGALAGGFILLAVPGVYFGIIFVFASTAAILEGNSVGPLKYSRELVRDHFWKVLLAVIIAYSFLYFPVLVDGVILGLTNHTEKLTMYITFTIFEALFWPVTHGIIVVSFLELRKFKKGKLDKTVVMGMNKRAGCGFTVLIYLILVSFMTGGILFWDKLSGTAPWVYRLVMVGVFPDGIKLKSAVGYRPVAYVFDRDTYTVLNSRSSLLIPSVQCFDTGNLAMMTDKAEQAFKLNDIITKKYDMDQIRKKGKFDVFKYAKLSTVNIGGYEWHKMELYDNRLINGEVYTVTWVVFYTFYKNDCLIADYLYKVPGKYNKENMPEPSEHIKNDENDFVYFIGAIDIPGQKHNSTGSGSKDADKYYSMGVSRYKLNDRAAALENLNKAVELAPGYTKAYWARGCVYKDLKDYKKALGDFDKAIELDPKYSDAYLARGNVKAITGDNKSAVEDLDTAIKFNPKLGQAYLSRGYIKQNAGDDKGALEDYNKAVEFNPNFAMNYAGRALIKHKTGDDRGAIEDYSKNIKLNPKEASNYIGRGYLKGKIGDINGAVEDIDKALAIEPNSVIAFMARTELKRMGKDYKGALKDYDKLIVLNPKDAISFNNRGCVKIELGDYKGALADANIAVKLDPKSGNIYSTRAEAENKLFDFKAALKDIEKAMELGLKEGEAYYDRGTAKKGLGDKKGADEDFKKAKELGFDGSGKLK